MKPPYHIGAVCIAMALAACSGAQTGVSPNTLPAADAPQTSPLFRAHKATTALMLVANEGAGMGGSILEFPEAANGNVAPSSVIAKNRGIPGPFAVGFNSTQGIAIADGNIDSSSLVGAETFAFSTGDFLTGITCFGKPSQTNAVAFDSKGQLFVSAFLPEGGRAVEVFAPGANGCVKPKRTISDEGGLAIDSNNLLYVANSKTATIDLFPAGSSTRQAQIGGSNTGLVAPGTVALDASRDVYVFDTKTATISEFAAGAHGNVAPIRTISGSKTGLGGGNGFTFGLAVSKTSGEIFVSNPGTNAILGFAATASGNVAPIQTIAGSATGLADPLGLAVTE
ncbi:MAG TPA: hypothetical protein VGZ06_06820 [Candidatus Cybelea sp.]|jgi:hypothetical protein|nr:hypothetical protein [Candidatus Cybelea sp.]